jgi:hypothetical protein
MYADICLDITSCIIMFRAVWILPADYTNSASEHIATVFSTGSALSCGIRSLPDALRPDFRQKLFEQLVDSGRRCGHASIGSVTVIKKDI